MNWVHGLALLLARKPFEAAQVTGYNVLEKRQHGNLAQGVGGRRFVIFIYSCEDRGLTCHTIDIDINCFLVV